MRARHELELTRYSAFWGQSFVTELTRISAHSADKFQAKKITVAASSEDGALIPEKAVA